MSGFSAVFHYGFPLCETYAKPIHAVLSNYGYDTAQDRSRVGGNL